MGKIDREKVYNKTKGYCGYCGKKITIKEMQVDHIVPQYNFKRDILTKENFVPNFLQHLGLGDLNHIDNLMCSCRSCNNYKSSFTLENFRKELGMQIERLNKNAQYKRAKRFRLVAETFNKINFYFEDKL